jgi:hypothetical protein
VASRSLSIAMAASGTCSSVGTLSCRGSASLLALPPTLLCSGATLSPACKMPVGPVGRGDDGHAAFPKMEEDDAEEEGAHEDIGGTVVVEGGCDRGSVVAGNDDKEEEEEEEELTGIGRSEEVAPEEEEEEDELETSILCVGRNKGRYARRCA